MEKLTASDVPFMENPSLYMQPYATHSMRKTERRLKSW